MPERWRSAPARQLVAAVRKAGGTIERTGRGKIRITGPGGSITLQETSEETRRDLRRNSAVPRIEEATGLKLRDQ